MKELAIFILCVLASSAFYSPFSFSAESQPEKKSDVEYSTPLLFFVQRKDGREKFRVDCLPEPLLMGALYTSHPPRSMPRADCLPMRRQ